MKGESNGLMFSTFNGDRRSPLWKKVGKDQNLNRIEPFHSLIVGQKQSGFLLNSRGELQSIGQADRVSCPNDRRRFCQFLVNRHYGKRRERLNREFDFVGERKAFIGERFCQNLGECHRRGDRAQSMIFQQG